jgi:protein involved in temperature-dependent protein secretion
MEGDLLSIWNQPRDSQPAASVCTQLYCVAAQWTQATDDAIARLSSNECVARQVYSEAGENFW